MTRFVALWRGINVGKAKRLTMADLKRVLGELGATRISTLLNSGNVVFDAQRITAAQIQQAVQQQLGVDAAVILKTAAEFAAIAAEQPIAGADEPSRLLVVFTAGPSALQGLEALADERDQLIVTPSAAYLWCPAGILASKTGERLLRRLGDAGTTRNWATVEKLRALL